MWQSSCARTGCLLTRESAWRVWTDAYRWPGGDPALESARLDGGLVPDIAAALPRPTDALVRRAAEA